MDSFEAAWDFIKNEKQFQLGDIPTEQPNPLTRGLSARIARDTCDGIACILSADESIAPIAEQCFQTDAFAAFVTDVKRAIMQRRRVLLTSVGASGRMALQLDSTWKQFWMSLIEKIPLRAQEWLDVSHCTDSQMTGGDRACVRSVENFEDYMTFGAQQIIDAGVKPGDVVITLAECGLSSSTIGAAMEAQRQGCKVYYLYCNPKEILCEKLERAAKVFACEEIVFMPLFVGNMAVSGSTRMQVTTIELLVAGAALELGSDAYLKEHCTEEELQAIGAGTLEPLQYARQFAALVEQLMGDNALCAMAKAVEYETDTYSRGGLITYTTHAYLQDILTDTTERQPTFTLPPFRKRDETDAPLSWAYAKDPLYPSNIAWQHILRRPIQGLAWTPEDYRRMGAAQTIVDNPPQVGSDELLAYAIGNERDQTRFSKKPAHLMCVDVDGASARDGSYEWYQENVKDFDGGLVLRLGDIPKAVLEEGELRISVALPRTIMSLLPHLMVKLVFNLLSTATMAKMGRVLSNWMIQVLPTNKKLIDRSVRIIAELAQIPYERACEEFFKSYILRPKGEEYRESYVVETLKRLGIDLEQLTR